MTTGNANTSAGAAERVLMVGATSSLAQAMCRVLARRGWRLTLCARDEAELELLGGDLLARYGMTCELLAADFLSPAFSAQALLEQAGSFDHVIIAAGSMGGGPGNEDFTRIAQINYTVPAQIALLSASYLSARKRGSIVIISSVAGDRGRRRHLAYGSAKAALSAFASGLRAQYYPHGVHVMTVKPGFVDTPMTWGMKSPLIADRNSVAESIVEAMKKKRNIVYVPWFWRYIMLVIRHIPEPIFKRLKL